MLWLKTLEKHHIYELFPYIYIYSPGMGNLKTCKYDPGLQGIVSEAPSKLESDSLTKTTGKIDIYSMFPIRNTIRYRKGRGKMG